MSVHAGRGNETVTALNRRHFLGLSVVAPIFAASACSSSSKLTQGSNMFVCMHGITSDGFNFQTTMAGWAKAGIVSVEPDLPKAREFEQANGVGSARRLLDDLGLTPVSSSNQLFLDETGPLRDQAIEDLKWKVELMESLGVDRLVIPSTANQTHSASDYDELHENLIEAADIAGPHNVALMLEFTRKSTLVANVRTSLNVVRTIDHPNLKFMIDIYHFWSGTSKFEDLDDIRQGEVHHVHFADTPSAPNYEVFIQKDRAYPGEGIAPLQKIVDKLASKGYDGALSLELFDPVVRSTDPSEVASKAIATITPFIR